jgi:hypothetical protein
MKISPVLSRPDRLFKPTPQRKGLKHLGMTDLNPHPRQLPPQRPDPCPPHRSRYRPASRCSAMASKPHTPAAFAQDPLPRDPAPPQASACMADWLEEATAQGIKPEQALALIGLGLLRNIGGTAAGGEPTWIWSEGEDGGAADLVALKQRLELTDLALKTGAPLSTAEVSLLLGARPGGTQVQRGGLRARRLSRNVWKLSRVENGESSFQDGFRRRL